MQGNTLHSRMAAQKTAVSRIQGSLTGLAVCDAVGTTLEFRPPGSFEPIEDMVGGGPFQLLPGQVSSNMSQQKFAPPATATIHYCALHSTFSTAVTPLVIRTYPLCTASLLSLAHNIAVYLENACSAHQCSPDTFSTPTDRYCVLPYTLTGLSCSSTPYFILPHSGQMTRAWPSV